MDKRLHQLNLDYQIKSIEPPTGYLSKVIVINDKGCCTYCKSVSEMEFDYNYSQSNSVVDTSKCLKEGFRPMWTCANPPKRDSNGDLIQLNDTSTDSFVKPKKSKFQIFLIVFIIILVIIIINS